VLKAPALASADVFDRNPIAAASVPDDIRRRWERTLVKLRPVSSKAQAMCNSGQLLGIDGQTLVLSAKGSKFVMDSVNDQRLRSTVEPVIEEVFGQKLGLRCELNGRPMPGPSSAPTAPSEAPPEAGPEAVSRAVVSDRPPTLTEPPLNGAGGAPHPQPAPPRDLVSEARNNPTVRMAMDAFGASIESVIPAEDSRAAG